METEYLTVMHASSGISREDRTLFDSIIHKPSAERSAILRDLKSLVQTNGLAYALLALYRQQVNCGFVLADPLSLKGKESRVFFDQDTGVEFQVLWNPDRELRRNHSLLIQRGVIAHDTDTTRLINKDKEGKPCYLCAQNIAIQNPAEILLPLQLDGEEYFAGANFAYITNNHFTLMSSEHRAQRYRPRLLAAITSFLEQTEGQFRAIFNGLAGASIPWHEHMQVTTEKFPIEDICIHDSDIVYDTDKARVSKPLYYVPLWIVEGSSAEDVNGAVHRILARWHGLDAIYHTENIICVRQGAQLRMFLFLRDTRKLAGPGKVGAMASFECGGRIVLSYVPEPRNPNQTNERETFDRATLQTVKDLLAQIHPRSDSALIDSF